MANVSYLTSTSLLSAIKIQGLLPSSSALFSDEDLLSIANQEIKIGMVPTIIKYHEEFFVRDSSDITIEASKSNYPIPYRAVGQKFRELFYKDSSGNLLAMTRISPDDRPHYTSSTYQNRFLYFYLRGNDVVLVPDVSENPVGSLMFSYYFRPNELVMEDRVATIVGISTGDDSTTYTLDTIPTGLDSFVQDGVTLTGFSTSAKMDILQRRPGHRTINFDISPTSINTLTKTIIFDNDDVSTDIIIGDYIAFSGECIIPQMPCELHEILVQKVIQRIAQGMGDAQNYQLATGTLAEMKQNTDSIIDNRSEGQPRKANNLYGLVRSGRRGYF